MANSPDNQLPAIGIVTPSKELPIDRNYKDTNISPLEYFIKHFTLDWPGAFAAVYHHTILRSERRPEEEPIKRKGETRYSKQTPFPDPFTILNMLARSTTYTELYTAVLVTPQMQTAELAQKVSAIANLSKGRFNLGVGVGWNKHEYDALGKGEIYQIRGKVLNEQLKALRKLLTGEAFTGQVGPRENFDQMAINPPSNYEVPIWVGGQTPAARKRAASFDGWMPLGDVEQFQEQIDLLKQYLEEEGKNIHDFKSMGRIAIGKTPKKEWVDAYIKWQEAKATHVVLTTTGKEEEYNPEGKETDPYHHSRMIVDFLRLTSWLRKPTGSFSGLFAEPYSGDILELGSQFKNFKSLKLDGSLKIDHIFKFLLARGFTETVIEQFTLQGKQIGLNVVSQPKGLIGPDGIKVIFLNQENDQDNIFVVYDKEIELGFGNWHNFKQ